MTKCIICGKIVGSEDYSICNNCIKRNLTIDNVLDFGSVWTEEIEINGFLASYFKGYIDELEKILIDEIRHKQENDPDAVSKSIREYFDYDRDTFIRLLEEKWNRQR